jgi:hypothetical protein
MALQSQVQAMEGQRQPAEQKRRARVRAAFFHVSGRQGVSGAQSQAFFTPVKPVKQFAHPLRLEERGARQRSCTVECDRSAPHAQKKDALESAAVLWTEAISDALRVFQQGTGLHETGFPPADDDPPGMFAQPVRVFFGTQFDIVEENAVAANGAIAA